MYTYSMADIDIYVQIKRLFDICCDIYKTYHTIIRLFVS